MNDFKTIRYEKCQRTNSVIIRIKYIDENGKMVNFMKCSAELTQEEETLVQECKTQLGI